MKENNKIIVLPGAPAQIPLVKKLKSLGYHVTVFNPNPDSPAFLYADDYRLVDILDKNKCLDLAKGISPIGVISDMCDIAMPTVAMLSESLGLYSLGSKCAKLFTDKSEMRRFCENHNLRSPKYRLCHNVNEACAFYDSMPGKYIIKPLDSNSSRGVFTIENKDEIKKRFSDSIAYSKCDKAVLIEQYIDGTEFTIDGIVTPTGHKSLAISEKKHYEYNKNIAYQLYFSHNNPKFDYSKLREANDRFVDLSGLPCGCFTHAEYKYENGEFYLIEIGARGGGNFISSHIVPIMTGIDNYSILIDAIAKGEFKDVEIDNTLSDRCCVLYFFDIDKEGTVVKVSHEEMLSEDNHIVDYKFNFKIGERIKKAENDSARVGYYIAYGNNREELDSLMTRINENVKIEVNEYI